MSELNKEYKRIVKEIEEKITNKEEFEFTKNKIAELSLLFVNVIDRVTDLADGKIEKLEKNQVDLENKINKLSEAVDEIEKDIYDDEEDDSEGFDFEIVCPYCNHEFVTDVDFENKKDIKCPECHNVIELDFNSEEGGCSGNCSGCQAHCGEDSKDEDEDM